MIGLLDHPMPAAKTIAIFDLDRTITKKDTFMGFILGFLCREPWRIFRTLGLPVAFVRFALGQKDNGWLKQRLLNAFLGGVSSARLDRWVDVYVKRVLSGGLRPGAVRAIRRHRAAGERLVLATASLDFYVEAIGAGLGFDDVIATRADWTDAGTLSGKFATANCYGEEKLRRVKAVYEAERNSPSVVAYSDHHADLPLLRWADRAFAVNPTRTLAAAAESITIVDWNRDVS